MNVLWLLLDGGAVLGAAWLAWRALAGGTRGCIEELSGWGTMFVALVAGSGVVLGELGILGRNGFLAAHALLLTGAVGLRHRHLAGDRATLRGLGHAVLAGARTDPTTRILAIVLAVFLGTTGLMAAWAEPVVYDALTYRLARIGHWLQAGSLAHFATNDPRENYMPVVPDLLMAWLSGAGDEGFHGLALAQWGGGVLLLLATVGLARRLGLGRAAALGAALLAAGTANVAPQFTTEHTDLLTAGLLAAAFFLWHQAAGRKQGSWIAGLAGGLALGAKGTVLYLGPTLLLWAIWTGWEARLPAAAWRRTLLALIASSAIFSAPGLVRNWHSYGGPLGPPEFVSMHHQAAGGRLFYKTGLNLATSLAQVAEPNSQPPGLQMSARKIGEWLADCLPAQDPFSYEDLNRQETVRSVLRRAEPDADATSFGLPALVLFVAGAVGAMFSTRAGAGEIRRWTAGVLVFFVFFHAMQQWHPYGFRYFVLVAPWLAVNAAWWLEGLPGRIRPWVWGLALVAGLATAGQVLTHTHQAGWRAVTRPEGSRSYYVWREWRRWVSGLDASAAPLQVSLPFNRPIAAFYRLRPARTVQLRLETTLAGSTAEKALAGVDDGWLVVPALRFMDHEGRVDGRIWLFDGDPESPFSLAAYRRLAPGRSAGSLVYRHQQRAEKGGTRHEFLVRPAATGRVSLHLVSVAGVPGQYVVTTPTEVRRGEWPGGAIELSFDVTPERVSEMVVQVSGSDPSTQPPPTVEIRP